MESKIVITGVSFGLILASGFWLSHSAKPYQTILLSVHKLISLGALVLLIIQVLSFRKNAPLSPALMLACGIGVIGFVALFATGGMLSAMKTPAAMVQKIHATLPYVTILASAAGLFLMH